MGRLSKPKNLSKKPSIYTKFENYWKSNKLLTISVIIFLIIVGVHTFIQALYGIKNFYEDVFDLFSPNSDLVIQNANSTNFTNNTDSLNLKCFLLFSNKNQFDIWHQEVQFRLGLPKHPRNLLTKEIGDEFTVKQYANWRKNLDTSDNRVICGFNTRVPKDLIDEQAEKKYAFIKVSYKHAEEMGFIKDKPSIFTQEIFQYTIPDLPVYEVLKTPEVSRKPTVTPEYNIELVIILHKQFELRNKYIFDLGSIDNKSRISVYLDKDNYLCFRVIDENSKAYIVKLSNIIFERQLQFNFKFAKHPSISYMEIYLNGKPVAEKIFNYRIPFYYYDNNKIFIAANLDGTYCSALRMYWANVFATKDKHQVKLLTYDARKTDAMFLSDNEIIVYKTDQEKIDFHRR